MKNDLFNQTLMRKYSKVFKLTPSKHALILKHIQKLEEGQFEAETKNYIYFYEVWLKGILGYDLDENILIDEKEEQGRGKSEFILKSGDKKFMVVELKDQKTDLDRPQNRINDKRTPIDQAFDYAQHTGDIDWIFVSNYNEFRLYNWHKKGHFISFKAGELLDKTLFSYFMLSFSKKSYIDAGVIDKLMDKTVVIERTLKKEFYKLYNETRLMLIKEFEEFNGCSRLIAIHYAQMVMNRYMFICFAEDFDILPSQISTDTILTPIIKGNLRHGSIWQRLNELFLDINEGNEYKNISECNGGIFSEDLEKINIRDIVEDQNFFNDVYQNWKFEEYEKGINTNLGTYGKKINPIYRNMLTISSFDFSTELDVNILGHIFENSIGDIEELKEDSKGRRKKEGVFYTPEYITDYICRNTIIPFLSYDDVNTVDELIKEYSNEHEIQKLESKVMNLKIIDPACGSGAFLNKASDILLEIHQSIYDFKRGQQTTIVETKGVKGKNKIKNSAKHIKLDSYFDQAAARREILINNIYGVDLNEESVDITKLALFLKVCQKDRKLPDLDNNIKCGDSLIDDPEFTEKSFIWKNEFPEVFKSGGFDIVIGNPPYVRQEQIKKIKPYLKDKYSVFSARADLYIYFYEQGLNILKNEGLMSFISSNKFTRIKYGKPLRNLILEHTFLKYFDFTYFQVFQDATVESCILTIKKIHPDENEILVNEEFTIPQRRLDENGWNFDHPLSLDLMDKLYLNGTNIGDIPDLRVYYGVKTGFNDAFIITQKVYNELISFDPKSRNLIKPLLRGKDIKKWIINYKNLYILFVRYGEGKELKNNFPAIYSYLKKYEKFIKNRGQVKNGQHNWLELDNNPSIEFLNEFCKEKIIWQRIAFNPTFCLDKGSVILDSMAFLISNSNYNLNYLLAIFNSKLMKWFLKHIGHVYGDRGFLVSNQYINRFPLYLATVKEQEPLIERAEKLITFNQDLQNEVNGFKRWVQKEFKVKKLSKNLDEYYELSEDLFIDELKKNKVIIKSRKNRESLEREFNESIAIIKPLLQKIAETDNEIDQIVYGLYGLTDDEKKIIDVS